MVYAVLMAVIFFAGVAFVAAFFAAFLTTFLAVFLAAGFLTAFLTAFLTDFFAADFLAAAFFFTDFFFAVASIVPFVGGREKKLQLNSYLLYRVTHITRFVFSDHQKATNSHQTLPIKQF